MKYQHIAGLHLLTGNVRRPHNPADKHLSTTVAMSKTDNIFYQMVNHNHLHLLTLQQ